MSKASNRDRESCRNQAGKKRLQALDQPSANRRSVSWLPRGAALDALFVFGALEDGVDENAGRVHLVRVKLADVEQLFDFGDDIIGGGGHHGIEVARGLAVDEVAPAVAFPRLDEREVAAQAALHYVHAAVEFAGLFALGDHGAVAGGCVEGGNARAAGTEALAERALRVQLDLQLAAKHKLLEELVLPDVGRDHFLDLALLEEQTDAEVIHAGVIADDGEVLRAFAANGGDEVLRDAAEAEATHEYGGAVVELGDGGVCGSDAFVHEEF